MFCWGFFFVGGGGGFFCCCCDRFFACNHVISVYKSLDMCFYQSDNIIAHWRPVVIIYCCIFRPSLWPAFSIPSRESPAMRFKELCMLSRTFTCRLKPLRQLKLLDRHRTPSTALHSLRRQVSAPFLVVGLEKSLEPTTSAPPFCPRWRSWRRYWPTSKISMWSSWPSTSKYLPADLAEICEHIMISAMPDDRLILHRWQKLKHCDFLGHYRYKCQTLHGRNTYWALSIHTSYHFQWPWLYFKVTAMSHNFNWKCYVLLQWSWNFAWLLITWSLSCTCSREIIDIFSR